MSYKMLLLSFGRNYSKFQPLLSKFLTFHYCSSVTTNWHLQFRFYIHYRPYTWIFYGVLQGHNGHIYSVGKLHPWQREKVVSMRVNVRNISNAFVSRKMRESSVERSANFHVLRAFASFWGNRAVPPISISLNLPYKTIVFFFSGMVTWRKNKYTGNSKRCETSWYSFSK